MESPDQPGDQTSRNTAEPVHRQSCRHACGHAATGPSHSDGVEGHGNPDQPGDQACRVPTDSTHRQGCCRHACGDAVKGPSDSDCIEDGGKSAGAAAGAVRRQTCGGACGLADAPVPPVALQERISERTHKQIVDVPMPHVALKERISERIHEQTVDQPGDQACRDPADSLHRQGCRYACGDATTGESDSGPPTQFVGRVVEALMACVRWHAQNAAASPRASRTTHAIKCGEYSHIRECAACIWYACTSCTEAAQAAKLPWEARRRRGRGRHWW